MDDLSVVRQAILTEIEGKTFYEMTANQTANEEVKEVLEFLRDQEIDHEKWLGALFEKLLQNKHFDLEWGTWLELQLQKQKEREKQGKSPKLFAKARESFKSLESDLAVIKAAALMEQAAIDFYSKAAKYAISQEAKQLYGRLIEWEKDHLKYLEDSYEYLSKLWLENYEFTYSPSL